MKIYVDVAACFRPALLQAGPIAAPSRGTAMSATDSLGFDVKRFRVVTPPGVPRASRGAG